MRVRWMMMAALVWMAAGCSKKPNDRMNEVRIGEKAEAPTEKGASSETDALKRAQAAAMEFNRRLRATLESTIDNQGAPAAIEVCAVAAPAIAEDVMREHQLRLGRVAAPGKQRNPEHAAEGWRWDALREMIEAVEAGAPVDQQVKVIREDLPEGVTLRMVRGIPTEALCTTCHGEEIDPAVEEKLRLHYPGDGATGFREGMLRGALWVEVTTL